MAGDVNVVNANTAVVAVTVDRQNHLLNEAGKWQCQFCESCVASKSYLAKHTRRDHEGFHECRGPKMALYLQHMSRWLCGSCLRSNPSTKITCDECQLVRDECEVDGDDGTQLRIPEAGGSATLEQEDVSMTMEIAEAGPTLSEIFEVDAVLLEHVPVKCRVQFADALAKTLDNVASHNDDKSWSRFFMLAKCCLWVPPSSRGGRKARGKDALSNIIASRLAKWQADEHAALWDEMRENMAKTKAGLSRSQGVSLAEQQAARAKRLAAEGLYSRASDALTSNGLHKRCDEVVQTLKNLHPRGPQVSPAEVELTEAIEFDVPAVKKALGSFPKLSGAGRSGLRPQHIKDAAGCKSPIMEELVVGKLTRVVNMLAAGEGLEEVAPYLAGAPLMAGIKDDGGTRPIAVGEALRRLVGKCWMQSELVKEACGRLLEPQQLGVGSHGGAEAIVRAASMIVAGKGHDPDTALMKIDFRNAFNLLSRNVFLKELDDEIPELAHWARWCYKSPSHLWFQDGSPLESSEGVQQGDPIGPLLFALGLRSVSRGIGERFPNLALQAWYLDDGIVVGPRRDLAELVALLSKEDVKARGFDLNVAKCEVWWPSGDQSFPEMHAEIKRAKQGVDILKIPLGNDAYVKEKLQSRIDT